MPASAVGLLACGTFGAAMLHVTLTDLRHRRIRNWLVGALAALWAPLALAAGVGPGEMALAALAAGLVFACGLGCFAAGWLGGGDVKLASASVLWLGAGQAVDYLLLASVLGAALTALVLAARLALGARAGAGPAAAAQRQVPYGPALAAAGLALLPGSPLTAGI